MFGVYVGKLDVNKQQDLNTGDINQRNGPLYTLLFQLNYLKYFPLHCVSVCEQPGLCIYFPALGFQWL